MITRRGLLAAGPLLAVSACAPATVATPSASTGQWHGTHLPEGGADLPSVTLTDQHGQPFNLASDVTSAAVALFFGYTNCPDVCPGIMADMATAKRRLPEDLVDELTLILVTTDPARDTPDALGSYLARVDESFIGLTGDLAVIKPAALSLGIDISEGKQLPSGGYEVDHGSYVLGFGKQRRLAVVWQQLSPAQLRADYELLIRAEPG